MALINCLRKVLDDKVLRARERSCNGSQALELRDKQSGMAVKITGILSPVLAIRMNGHLPDLKKGGTWGKICDYLLIYQSDVRYHAVLIELKRSLTEETKGKEQLMRSLPILDYLLSVCKIECDIGQQTPSIRYVLIANKISDKFDKQPIKAKPSEETDEKYEKITLRKLIGTEFAVDRLTH